MRRTERMLTDRQWDKIRPLLPKLRGGPKGGRPWADDRAVLAGILWVLKTGARWRDLPPEYPSPATCWRRLWMYEQLGVWDRIWRSFLRQLETRHRVKWQECFVDATFAPAKGGAIVSGRPSGAKGRR
ncbi:MAG: transposase [candidate division Zixibacteria bacterium]|nr:transposase [candidate division Zixibacteria bacterium]